VPRLRRPRPTVTPDRPPDRSKRGGIPPLLDLDLTPSMDWLVEYAMVPTASLPPNTVESPACLVPGAVPPPGGRGDCCHYHNVDWAEVMQLLEAVLFVRGPVLDRAKRDAVFDWPGYSDETRSAAWSLLAVTIVVASPLGEAFINGRHRAQAIRDQGLPRLLVERNPPADERVLAQDDQ